MPGKCLPQAARMKSSKTSRSAGFIWVRTSGCREHDDKDGCVVEEHQHAVLTGHETKSSTQALAAPRVDAAVAAVDPAVAAVDTRTQSGDRAGARRQSAART